MRDDFPRAGVGFAAAAAHGGGVVAHPTRAKPVEEAVQGLVGPMIDLREARNHL
ncbi:hypothetical protein [Kitasatospora sp. NPDC005748]|uniref:hypothetical protein n=1 Tax=Kitasatospora sp. NPDC005748 TaxID=3157063 RepID=UPI0033F19FBC